MSQRRGDSAGRFDLLETKDAFRDDASQKGIGLGVAIVLGRLGDRHLAVGMIDVQPTIVVKIR